MSSKTKRRLSLAARYICIIAVCIIMIFPIYWMVMCSLMPTSKLMIMPPTFFSLDISFESYAKILSNAKYMGYFKNSFIVATATVFITSCLAIPAGYAFSRYKFPGRSGFLAILMSSQIFPVVVMMITIYAFFMRFHLLNTHVGLILADVASALPLAITMIKSYFDTIPRSLDEAARIDGAGRLQSLWHIIMPLIKPGIVAIAIYTFLGSWDDYLMASIVMQKTEMRTITVGIAEAFFGEYSYDYAGMMAFVVCGALPIVVTFTALQKHLIAGLTAGAVKG